TFFGGSGDSHITVTIAPTSVDGGAGIDTLELAASMTLASGSVINVEKVQVDNGVTANLSNLTTGKIINLASTAGGGATVIGTRGADTMTGGGGNDFLYVDSALDVVNEAAGGGNDRVFASVSYTLKAGQEVETLTTSNNAGTGAINLAGNELANIIF